MDPKRPRGRPRSLEKAAAILQAARDLFLHHGVEAVRIEDIAAVAGVSKMTVYANFTDKAAMFEAIIDAESTAIEQAVVALPGSESPVDKTLTHVGSALLTLLLRDDVMRLDRMLAGEMTRHPDLGQRFYQAGPRRMWLLLTRIIQQAHTSGDLSVTDPQSAAEDLLALWLGMLPTQQRFGAATAVTAAMITRRAEHGVTIFMRAYGSIRAKR